MEEGRVVEMFQLKIMPIASCFKRISIMLRTLASVFFCFVFVFGFVFVLFFQIFNIDRTPHRFLSILSYRTPAFSFRCTISSAHFQPRRPGGIILWWEGEGGYRDRIFKGKVSVEPSLRAVFASYQSQEPIKWWAPVRVEKNVRKTYRAGEPIRTFIFTKSVENI